MWMEILSGKQRRDVEANRTCIQTRKVRSEVHIPQVSYGVQIGTVPREVSLLRTCPGRLWLDMDWMATAQAQQ